MVVYNYKTRGVCSSEISLKIEGEILVDILVTGGCNGNLQGIRSLVKGMKLDDVIKKLSGIKCGVRNTSCPDQIAEAIKEYKGELLK